MKFGLMSIDFKRLQLESAFRFTQIYEFDGLEIFGSRCHLYPDDFNLFVANQIIEFQEKYGVEVPMYTPNSLNLPFCICSPNENERNDGVEYYKRAIDIASKINCKRILVVADHPGYFTPRKIIWKHLVSSIKQLCSYASKKNIEITIEPLTPMESPVITTVDDCVSLLEEVNDKTLFVMMDIVPPTVVHEPISKYFDMLGDRLNYIHICNSDGKTDAHLRLDQGVLPIFDVIDVIKHHGYNDYVTCELYSESFHDPEILVANTSRFIRTVKKELL